MTRGHRSGPRHEAALKVVPKNPTYRTFYTNNLRPDCRARLALNDHAGLAAVAEELARDGVPAPATCKARPATSLPGGGPEGQVAVTVGADPAAA